MKIRMLKSLYSIKEKNIVKSVEKELYKIKDKSISDRDVIMTLVKKIESYKIHDVSWKDFELLFIQSHEDFVDKLKKESSILTRKQVRFCMFIKWEWILMIFVIFLMSASEAVEQQRYRIKKQLNITKSLDDFILDL